jgi:hypothetical protein
LFCIAISASRAPAVMASNDTLEKPIMGEPIYSVLCHLPGRQQSRSSRGMSLAQKRRSSASINSSGHQCRRLERRSCRRLDDRYGFVAPIILFCNFNQLLLKGPANCHSDQD